MAISPTPLIAVDIGNSRIKLGLFDGETAPANLPSPTRVLELDATDWQESQLAAWLPAVPIWPEWRVASVNRPAAARLVAWIDRACRTPAGTPAAARLLTAADLPIEVALDHPERIGIDRLAAAVAANRLRAADRAAIVVDTGSAITVDFVSANGVFRGGAILPGIDMSARALHEYTDLLPLVAMGDLSAPPEPVGGSTVMAIRSGLFWLAVGAIHEFCQRCSAGVPPPPEVFLTGGAAAHLVGVLGREFRYEPHLVVAGIALRRLRIAMDEPHPLQVVRLTPEGRGAIAVLLVVGERAAEQVGRHFFSRTKTPLGSRPLNQIYHGHWAQSDGEDVVVCRRNPTAVEIHCHGGRSAAERIVADLAINGCQEIAWREWLERNEPSAIRAAALIQLADARTERMAAILLDQLNGALEREIHNIANLLRSGNSSDALPVIKTLIERSGVGLRLVEPWRVVLAGPPNVGKSSLINVLLGYRRAIVFDQPGTTRDVVTAAVALDGWPIELSDTAGLRASDDALESAGVELARRKLAAADCIIFVTDCRQPIEREMQEVIENHRQAILVGNKADLLEGAGSMTAGSKDSAARHLTSAVTGLGISELAGLVVHKLVHVETRPGDAVPFTQQQVARLVVARDSITAGNIAAAETNLNGL